MMTIYGPVKKKWYKIQMKNKEKYAYSEYM